MQKVEGSSPFIRSSETRWKRHVSRFSVAAESATLGRGSALGSALSEPRLKRDAAKK
jgi:hypothetical protein